MKTSILVLTFAFAAPLGRSQPPARVDPVVVGLDAAIHSLQTQPSVFVLAPSCTGVSVANSGGTGIKVDVTGGGPGSQTTGFNVSMNGAQCQITANAASSEVVRSQVERAVSLLTEIKTLIQRRPIDKEALNKSVGELKQQTLLPPAIASITDALIKTKLP